MPKNTKRKENESHSERLTRYSKEIIDQHVIAEIKQ